MSPSNVDTSALRTLHRIHRQISELKDRQVRGPRQIAACEGYVENQNNALAAVEEEYKTMRMAADAKQVQLKGGEDKIVELQGKLNTAASNREYQALKDQIAALKVTNSVLDDEILEAWDKLEAFEGKIDEAKAGVEKAKEKLASVSAEVKEEQPLIEVDLARLEGELKESEAALPASLKEQYSRVVRHMGEDALASVRDQCCQGCYQQVPINSVAETKLGRPVFCKSCGRLLYIPENE